MRSICLETPTAKAFNSLSELMVKMRHESVEAIKDGFHSIILEFEHELNERYIITDRQTGRSVHYGQLDLMRIIGETEWWNYGIIELLKLDEDEALEQMSWIAEPELAPDGWAPEDRYLSMISEEPLPDLCSPVGRDSYIDMIKGLGGVSLAQTDLLRLAIEYLQKVPTITSQGNVAQEAKSIARVKHFLRDRWAGQNRKARHLYTLLMNGRGSGIDDLDMKILQRKIAHLELNE
ncbi:hypothetical protein E8E12_005972 [Didymella heteroderae]|uniref:Uncharacterized protein n=1 Tax=Didymella heteroderae TaxID=1769908 RepID=A0A9P4WNU6_9PLEO|nr:hypothetical protein E8E12_005972 [Didymella heteroderae]